MERKIAKINQGIELSEYLAQCWALGGGLINLSTQFLTHLYAPRPHSWAGLGLGPEALGGPHAPDVRCDCLLSSKLEPGHDRCCFLQSCLRGCLIVINADSDINQQPSPASCCVTVDGTGCCPDLVKHVKQFPYLVALTY